MILRPYQVESIGDLREQFRQGHTKIVLAAPTGSGKKRDDAGDYPGRRKERIAVAVYLRASYPR